MMKRVIDPCQAICRFDEEDICIGCFRQRQEINNWRFMSETERQTVVERVKPKIEARLEEERKAGAAPISPRYRQP